MKIVKKSLPISWLYDTYPRIDMSPYYQRESSVWGQEKKQLLIDSVFNRYDIPKIYLHMRPSNIISYEDAQTKYEYSVIDGKQRISTIIEFITNVFPLSKSIELNENQFPDYNQEMSIKNMLFSEISNRYPFLISEFMNYVLDFVIIDTDDPTIIEDMFLRLNAGVHLNSAEKRIVAGRALTSSIKSELLSHRFFCNKISFHDNRGAYFDAALKLLVLEYSERIVDLTSNALDNFIKQNNGHKNDKLESAITRMLRRLDTLNEVFADKDKLLSAKNMLPLYYVLAFNGKTQYLKEFILWFNEQKANVLQEEDTNSPDYALFSDFTLYSQQGAYQKVKFEQRYQIISGFYDRYINR